MSDCRLLEGGVQDVFELRTMHETLELSAEQKRSTDDGIQIMLELPVPKKQASTT